MVPIWCWAMQGTILDPSLVEKLREEDIASKVWHTILREELSHGCHVVPDQRENWASDPMEFGSSWAIKQVLGRQVLPYALVHAEIHACNLVDSCLMPESVLEKGCLVPMGHESSLVKGNLTV